MNLRAAQVRIYVDADLLGLGKILAGLRNDVTHPGDPGAAPIAESVLSIDDCDCRDRSAQNFLIWACCAASGGRQSAIPTG